MNKDSNLVIAYIFLVLAPMTVGVNIVGSKYLIASIPILFLLAVRFVLATVLLFPLHWCTPEARYHSVAYYLKQLTKKDWVYLILQALSAGVFFNFLMVLGLRYTDANAAGVITSALPAIIVVLSSIVLGEPFTLKKGICVGFATLGLLVISADNISGINSSHALLGSFIVFLSLLPEASYYILTKLHPSRLPLFLMSAVINGINAIVLLPMLFYYFDLNSLALPIFSWMILILVGLASGLFYVFWYIGSSKVDAVMAALSTAIMPVATLAIAWMTLGEKIGLVQYIGVALVIASIVAYALPAKSKLN